MKVQRGLGLGRSYCTQKQRSWEGSFICRESSIICYDGYRLIPSLCCWVHHCAVINCYNNKRKLDKWRQSECNLHPGTTKGLCPCPEPFRLFCFPGPKLYKDRRDRWVKLMRRTTLRELIFAGINFRDFANFGQLYRPKTKNYTRR